MRFLKTMLRDEDGATAIEYGLIAALIAVAAITAMGTIGDELTNTFNDVSTELVDARNQGDTGGSTGGDTVTP